MRSLLALARDYIERIANPVFGITMNEDYTGKFGTLLQRRIYGLNGEKKLEPLKTPMLFLPMNGSGCSNGPNRLAPTLIKSYLYGSLTDGPVIFVRAEISRESRGENQETGATCPISQIRF
jgi:hypothetical protein